jgi:hypothetical protein
MTPEECPSLFRDFLTFSVGGGGRSEAVQSNEQGEAGEQSSTLLPKCEKTEN